MCSKGDIYIASCVETGGIYHYKLQNGKLTLVDMTPMDRPMYMVMQERKMYIVLRAPFADSNDSGVVVYDVDAEGKLVNPSDIMSTKGQVACHICVDGEEIYCANYTSGSTIKLPDNLVQHAGKGVHPNRQEGPHVHFVGLTPDKKYICATDLGLDTIFLYNRDMTLHSQAKVPAGHGVRHLVFSDDGKWLFAANELKSTLSLFAYEEGKLTHMDVCSTLPETFTGTNLVSAIRFKEGLVYVSNRGHDSVAVICPVNGKLHLVEIVPCGGKTPRDMDFAGDYLICTNMDSNTITVLNSYHDFAVTHTVEVEAPLCVCIDNVPGLEVFAYEGEGYQPQVDFNGWRVALANYAPHLELAKRNRLERHLETDEVFVLLEGTAGLLVGKEREKVVLQTGKIYNVKRGIWHCVFMETGAKVLIVENSDTGPYNTEFMNF